MIYCIPHFIQSGNTGDTVGDLGGFEDVSSNPKIWGATNDDSDSLFGFIHVYIHIYIYVYKYISTGEPWISRVSNSVISEFF